MKEIKIYDEALSFMYDHLPMYQRVGQAAYKKDLTNTLLLSQKAGDPHKSLKCIHIAGTNGKGTTTHLIAAGLQSQGYQVGVYTSPHYKDFRERIKINGKYISRQYIIRFLNEYRQAIEEIRPSFFEMTVVMAFSYFAHKKVDYAVIETGLGGRLDSTNIITPLLSVITNISYDHQNLLGDTLGQIALEKAGIIKPKVPVVIGERQDEIDALFITKATESGSQITFASDEVTSEVTERLDSMRCLLKKSGRDWLQFDTSLFGPFQVKNIVTAFWALEILKAYVPLDFVKVTAFIPGFKEKTGYMGRWQILNKQPLTIADSAHNEGGLRIVTGMLANMSKSKMHMVLGFVNDKDLSKVLPLFPANAEYYFAKANIPRGLPAEELKTTAQQYGLMGKNYSSVKKALAAARKKAGKDDLIFVGGSIFVVAEVI